MVPILRTYYQQIRNSEVNVTLWSLFSAVMIGCLSVFAASYIYWGVSLYDILTLENWGILMVPVLVGEKNNLELCTCTLLLIRTTATINIKGNNGR